MRFSAYRIMWLFVFFDLPTRTDSEKKTHARFRKDLLKDGFTMMQYSVYDRHCASAESVEAHIKRIGKLMPPKGHVSIMQLTDKQYGGIINLWGKKSVPLPESPGQLEIF